MDDPPRKIEIFAPFSAAIDLTKVILFQPFDIAKWLVIGFAAFLANLVGGGGGNYRFSKNFSSAGDWKFHSVSRDFGDSSSGWPAWVWPLIIIGGLLMIAVVFALMWVGARGKFLFADCVVRNRAAIVEPWREFAREGNSYFRFLLLAALCVILALGLAGAPLLIPFALHGDWPSGVGLFVGVFFLGIFAIAAAAWLHLVSRFMIPIMYRQRCDATTAFRESNALVTRHPGPVLLYLLFSVVLGAAFVAIACVLTCITCCITAIPYVGTVILLPVYVFFMAFLLLFVRQFGPEYDSWATVAPLQPTPTLTDPPTTEPPPILP
ncbi:MAG: hypothetical protein ABR526_05185 [Chthoniobacterales bacterium]